MLDARIYRTGLVVAALALVVLAFSLTNPPGPLSSSLAPEAFSGANVQAMMQSLNRRYPDRTPGSAGDAALARQVAGTLGQTDGFSVSTDSFAARTAAGQRTISNVIASRPGTKPGAIVIVAGRDTSQPSAPASLSSTATLLELGRDLAGETLQRTVVLASTSATAGSGGIARLARELPGPIDAVIVLGDLAAAHPSQPIIIPWSMQEVTAPTALRSTLSAALQAQGAPASRDGGLLGQLAHLSFPLTISQQAPFARRGVPAVELSLSGERGPLPGEQTAGTGALTQTGRGVLASISALDGGADLPAPSTYVLFDGKSVPGWAISLFVLSLIVPVALTTIDGVARARRRGYRLGRSLTAVLGASLPFVAAIVVVLFGRLVGLVSPTAEPAGPGVLGIGTGGIAVLVVAALVMAAAGAGVFAAFRSLTDSSAAARGTRDSRVRAADRSGDGTAAAMLFVLCVVALLIWMVNPFAAALLVPALHLWLWAVDSDLSLPLPGRVAMILLGVVPTAGLVVYYADALHYGPGELVWTAVLLLAGHGVSLVAAVEWSLVLGCLTAAIVVVISAARRPEPVGAPVSVRGPVTYAGPGSLGGTKSALRR